MTRNERISIFCSEIWAWYRVHKRTLPWRDMSEKDADQKAYKVLVSEIMLQQTQVSRVIILYKNFIQLFPDTSGLAKASNRDVLLAWRGLGYNNRALRLRDAARVIVEKGMFPRDMEELRALPGVGHYTAGAVRNFAFGIPTACMDTNIRRILHRFFVGMENDDGTSKKDDKYMLKLAEEVLAVALDTHEKNARSPDLLRAEAPPLKGKGWSAEGKPLGLPSACEDWHAALMDFGSLVCTKHNPKWELFSPRLKSSCRAYGKQISRTKKVIKKEPGREMAGRYIPNRIFRGRIVEELRDAQKGLTPDEIGKRIALDWTLGDHAKWLSALLEGLVRDRMIARRRKVYCLAQ